MPRKFFKRYMPDHDTIRRHRHLQVFGKLLHDPNLFHLNRRSVSGAFAVGLFIAWLPVPLQMVIAAAAAIGVRVNLPLSAVLVWVSNPVTMPPMFFFAYKLGSWILGRTPKALEVEASFEWLLAEMGQIWEPLVLGSVVMGAISGVLGFATIRVLWRWQMVRQWQRRRETRSRKPLQNSNL